MNMNALIAKFVGLLALLGAADALAEKKILVSPPAGKNCQMTITFVAKTERVITKTYWSHKTSEADCQDWANGHRDNMTPAVTKSKTVEARYVK
ncbi:MAG: hypothetical protein JNL01_04970 [Bdellovibrionales bacterium]|nr:hypothetical protein [Bdellovibrionales bacterium]